MRVAQFYPAVVAVILIGGAVVFSIRECNRQAVVAVGVSGIVLGHAAAYGFFDDLYAVVCVVCHFGNTVATLACGEILGDADEAVEVVVGVVGNRYRGCRARAGGGGSGDCRTPGFEQLAGGGVGDIGARAVYGRLLINFSIFSHFGRYCAAHLPLSLI